MPHARIGEVPSMGIEDVTPNRTYTLGTPSAAVVREAANELRRREARTIGGARTKAVDAARRRRALVAAARRPPVEPMS
jgi:hypothetical protein